MGRICSRCGYQFNPTGKKGKICEPCKTKNYTIRNAHLKTDSKLKAMFILKNKELKAEAAQNALE